MYKICRAEKLAENIYLMDVEAPRVAKHCQPGQFIIVKLDEESERIPLTICDYDREKGTITIVFQPIGASTTKYANLKEGDAFQDFVGTAGTALRADPRRSGRTEKEKNPVCCRRCGNSSCISSGKMAA